MRIEDLAAYEIISRQKIHDLRSEGYLLRHKKSGARIALLSNEDENKVFYIGFKTPPADSTVFAPHRFKAGASAQQLAEDAACSIKGLSKRFLEPVRVSADHIPPGHGGVAEVDGEKLGVYRDEDGELHTIVPKCPHMGCQLEWNPDEKSWDCPCHGSRFDIYGHLLTGPAQADLP